MKSIEVVQTALEQVQQDKLSELFGSNAWGLLREVIGAHCNKAEAEFLDASLYDTEAAKGKAEASLERAKMYDAALNVLDEIQKSSEEWYRIRLESRR